MSIETRTAGAITLDAHTNALNAHAAIQAMAEDLRRASVVHGFDPEATMETLGLMHQGIELVLRRIEGTSERAFRHALAVAQDAAVKLATGPRESGAGAGIR